MNGRRRGTREGSRKQGLDSAWSMEMSKLTRDGTAEPVSRDHILRFERGQRITHFPCSTADHEQDWQPCPVVRAIHTNIVLHTHTAVVTHIYIYIYIIYIYIYAYYTTTVNRARMFMSPNKKYTGTWYTKQCEQQYCTSTYIYLPRMDTADHEQVWQPYAVYPYYSAISKWWPYLLALYINTDHQQ